MRRPLPGTSRVRRREDVARPRGGGLSLGTHYDPEAFGRFSEAIARYFGTARFLAIQSVIVIAWLVLNTIGFIHHWDPYPFILLNLLFSTQAAYAAPLILLAQNRQDARDRETVERDRAVAARTQADTEFLARELAAVRLALLGMATTDDLDASFGRIEAVLRRLEQRVNGLDLALVGAGAERHGGADSAGAPGPDDTAGGPDDNAPGPDDTAPGPDDTAGGPAGEGAGGAGAGGP